ncbi:hypothetical protein BJ138DRAFT_1118576 [Hygrophoropsis aurantiaca]|uniref:Uncharacterized protein n=1 Tax=Hygrophoropsis aurantiaca TaxID=72124 RepID=A0ACB7ZWK4_9AGAM|nr:hypothetical protein BJ138DRAFT_1118576 [Hygrophoropsis aurantiaca]
MSIHPPKTIDAWLAQYAEPTADWEWPTQLWKSAWEERVNVLSWQDVELGGADEVADVALPSRCLIMRDFGMQFDEFNMTGVYVRDEYLRIARGMVTFAAEPYAQCLAESTSMNVMVKADADATQGDAMQVMLGSTQSDAQTNSSEESLPPNPFLGVPRSAFEKKVIMQLTGSPGIGKSMFLHVLLGLRLNARLPTLFQNDTSECYLFTALGAHHVSLTTVRAPVLAASCLGGLLPSMWCLVGTDHAMPVPQVFVRYARCTIAQAAPPHRDHLEWADKQVLPSRKFWMAPFTVEEAILALPLSRNLHPSTRELQHWFAHYAPSGLRAYQHARRIGAYDASLTDNLPCLTRSAVHSSFPHSPSSLIHAASCLAHAVLSLRMLDADNSFYYEMFACYPRWNGGVEVGSWRVPTGYLAEKIVHDLGLDLNPEMYGEDDDDAKQAKEERMKLRSQFCEECARYPELDAVVACLTEVVNAR